MIHVVFVVKENIVNLLKTSIVSEDPAGNPDVGINFHEKNCQEWDLNPRSFEPAPEAGALDRSAILTCFNRQVHAVILFDTFELFIIYYLFYDQPLYFCGSYGGS